MNFSKILICLLCSIWSLPGLSQSIMVTTVDGQKSSVNMSEKPVITVSEGMFVISSNTSDISFPLESVEKYVFENKSTGVENTEISDAPFKMKGDKLIFNESSQSRHVAFYDMNGIMLKSFTIEAGGAGYFDISQLTNGTYLVRVNDLTIKILRK